MQSLSQPVSAAKPAKLGLAAAGTFAVLGICFAVQQLTMSSAKAPASATGPGGRGRVAAPEFWLRDHATGRARAQATGKPIFLVIRCEP